MFIGMIEADTMFANGVSTNLEAAAKLGRNHRQEDNPGKQCAPVTGIESQPTRFNRCTQPL
jgi:hypothetical protein